jgi:hypothetical protein
MDPPAFMVMEDILGDIYGRLTTAAMSLAPPSLIACIGQMLPRTFLHENTYAQNLMICTRRPGFATFEIYAGGHLYRW